MNPTAKILVLAGLALVAVGLAWQFLAGRGLPTPGRLPGDLTIERGNFKFYAPLTTSLILSVLISLALWIYQRFR